MSQPVKVRNPNFELFSAFSTKVDREYEHEDRLERFREVFLGSPKLYEIERGITDQNFSRVASRLYPGAKLTVAIFKIKGTVGLEECVRFLEGLRSEFFGPHAGTVLWKNALESLPMTKRCVFIDRIENLPIIGGKAKIPYAFRYGGGDWGFHLDNADEAFDEDYCFPCFNAPM
jgi:hypothetical protein